MTDEKPYIPLSERLKQDVWHDNFVPKYSAIGSARPSRLVLIGVWLIFGPMVFWGIPLWLAQVQQSPDLATTVVSTIGAGLMFTLAVAILFQQTRRYLRARHEGSEWHEE